MAESTRPGGQQRPTAAGGSSATSSTAGSSADADADDAAVDKGDAAKETERKARPEERQERAAQRGETKAAGRAEAKAGRDRARAEQPSERTTSLPTAAAAGSASGAQRRRTDAQKPAPAPRRHRRAQLRLTQIDAWSVMKTSFLLSIALGIVLVVAVAIIWAVLGAAGVWDSINSIVQQAVGSTDGSPFDVTDYVGTSRVLGLTMIVAVVDVVLITAIATLGAFLYNLSAALLGGIEVTLTEDN